MRIIPTCFDEAWLIDLERHEDARGFFARTWCQREFESHGLDSRLVQCSVSFNHQMGTLRGMHYQIKPHEEIKVVRCTRGSILDVIVDVRPGSATHGQYAAFELSAHNHLSLYIPAGFAHGFQTLEENTEVYYQMSEHFHADSARGFHHADPEVAIPWPLPITIISQKDEQLGPMRS